MRVLGDDVARTFARAADEERFRSTGVLELGPVLDAAAVAELRAVAEATRPADDRGLVIDYRRDDRRRLQRATALLEPLLEPILTGLFADHRMVLATFIAKYPDATSELLLHEDRTHVDESRFCGGNLWIPLDDVGPGIRNGGLQLVPRSHLIADNVVGSHTPDLWRPYEPYLQSLLMTPTLRAGEGVFYDNRTLHQSAVNETDEVRVALACLVVPRNATLRHAIAVGRRRRHVYQVDDDFFLELPPHRIDVAALSEHVLLEERVDVARLGPQAILDAVGDDGGRITAPALAAVVERPVLPDGLRRATRRLALVDEDPPNAAAALGGLDEPAGSDGPPRPAVQLIRGEAGTRWITSPDDLPDWCGAVAPLVAEDHQVMVVQIDPDGAVAIEAPDGHALVVDVVDAPSLGCRLVRGTEGVLIDEDLVVEVDRGGIQIWNHSLGAIVLALSCARAPGSDGPP